MKTNHKSWGRGRGDFRIESDAGLHSPHWTCSHANANANANANSIMVHERSLAVAMAAKTRSTAYGGEIRVVYAPTGEVIFRKSN
jgi:hypothetical protein